MTETTPTTPTPPEGLTDAQLDEMERQHWRAYARAATAGGAHEAARPPTPAPGLTFLDAIRLAQGCHDYSGGYGGAEGEAWHSAIGLVVDVLRRAAARPWDSQTTAVFVMGADTPALTPEPPTDD